MNNLKIQDTDPITAEDGLKLNARVAKNRCVYDNPYKKCEFFVIYGEGVDKLTEIMEKGPEAGIIRKSGAWFYYEKEDGELIEADRAIVNGKEEKNVPLKFQGKTAFREFMNENPWLVNQLKAEIRGKAQRGELIPVFQDEDEMKEIERLNAIEKEIAAEEEKATAKKKAAKVKASAKKEDAKTDEKPKKSASSSKKKESPKKDSPKEEVKA